MLLNEVELRSACTKLHPLTLDQIIDGTLTDYELRARDSDFNALPASGTCACAMQSHHYNDQHKTHHVL